ncbi:hypothetical protein [Fodinibius sp.]|uniref:hypothetical protein n=1 Tax=Fodinibius sp. TaxID=1872440 RepID=UPI002ACDFC90|nr:hypothetical protein [Fodinibius sp.]MDZ7659114.1 hypothetical protein [Fodinibius sp.]
MLRFKTLLFISSLLLVVFTISCENKSSKTDKQSTQHAEIDTTNMDEVQGEPIIEAPGAQIDRDKVTTMLDEENLSFREITNPDATAEETEESIEQLNTLLDTDSVRNDEELEYFVHTILSSTYLRLYEKTGEKEQLDKAENHVDAAISIFKDQPKYKADLVDAYTGRLAVLTLKDES